MPGDPWLIALEDAIYSAPEGPTDDQLILFANALNSQGFFEESLELSEYLGHRIPVDDSYRLTKVHQFRSDAFQQLGRLESANLAWNLSASLAAAAHLQVRPNLPLP